MSTDDILDAIDHAIRDVEVSADAMRWSPEDAAEDARDPSGLNATDVLQGREIHSYMERRRGPSLVEPLAGDWAEVGYTEDGSGLDALHGNHAHIEFNLRDVNAENIGRAFNVPASLLCNCRVSAQGCPMHRSSPLQGGALSVLRESGSYTSYVESHDAYNCNACNMMQDAASMSIRERDYLSADRILRELAAQQERHERERRTSWAYDIPVREDDPNAYYRALWRNARLGQPDGTQRYTYPVGNCVPYAAVEPARPDHTRHLFIGGPPPWDGSIRAMPTDRERTQWTVAGRVNIDYPLRLDEFTGVPQIEPIPAYTYVPQRCMLVSLTEAVTLTVYVCGELHEWIIPVITEAYRRGLVDADSIVER